MLSAIVYCTLLSSLDLVYFCIEFIRILLSCYVLGGAIYFCYVTLNCIIPREQYIALVVYYSKKILQCFVAN